jgi:hypothetical protein
MNVLLHMHSGSEETDMARQYKTFQIFRAGTHQAKDGQTVTYTANDLDRIAKAYDPVRWKAPLRLGHSETDGDPAYGHVIGLVAAHGNLYANALADDELVNLVRDDRYTNVSAGFYETYSPNNPTPGIPYLNHIAFLGATAPAVKGMAPLNFSEGKSSLNPLLVDAERRSNVARVLVFAESFSASDVNPLVADAINRRFNLSAPKINF